MDVNEYRTAVSAALQVGDPFILECALDGHLSVSSALIFVTLLEAGHDLSEYESKFDREAWEGQKGLALLQRLLRALRRNRTLSELLLYKCLVSKGSAFVSGMAEVLPCNSTLTRLHLENNELGLLPPADLARSLLSAGSLTQLFLDGNRIGVEGGRQLAYVLMDNTALRILSLGGNEIGAGGDDLAQMLMTNTTLRSVYLERNAMPPETMLLFKDVLLRNQTLRQLEIFPGNSIPFACSFRILNALEKNHSMLAFPWKEEEEEVVDAFLQRNRVRFLQMHSLQLAVSFFFAERPGVFATLRANIPENCSKSVAFACHLLDGNMNDCKGFGLWK